jgi:hypothetical protein
VGILKGIWGYSPSSLPLLSPSIDIFGIEITGLFQASEVTLVWSVFEVVTGFYL